MLERLWRNPRSFFILEEGTLNFPIELSFCKDEQLVERKNVENDDILKGWK